MMMKPPYLLVDTEFVREKTYFSRLCLIQYAGPGIEPAYIDPLDPKADLAPLVAMLKDPGIVKVFHSGYQDMEIFYHLMGGEVPAPVFDTQVAASVLGFGEQVSYARLVQDICGVEISKSHQFTDWSYRPLSQAQIDYALGDVIYLDAIYLHLRKALEERGRAAWIADDLAALADPQTYAPRPYDVWEKIKMRSDKPRHLAMLRALAAWREGEAMRRDMPRNFILRDDTLMEIAMTMPETREALGRVRGFPPSQVDRPLGQAMLKTIAEVKAADPSTYPRRERGRAFPQNRQGILEMLRLLLKIEAAHNDITPGRIASKDDLEAIALHGEKADVPAMKGWRFEIFGSKCADLMHGKVGLSIKNGEIDISAIQP